MVTLETTPKPAKTGQIRELVAPLLDWHHNPWPERGSLHSLVSNLFTTKLGTGIAPYLADVGMMEMFFDSKAREEARRNIPYETIRSKTERDLVGQFIEADPFVFIAAAVGDLKNGFQWHDSISDDHPTLQGIARNVELFFRQNALAFIPMLATPLLRDVNGIDIATDAGLIAANTVVAKFLTTKAAEFFTGSSDSLRRSVDPDPLHLRMAAGVALAQDFMNLPHGKQNNGGIRESVAALKTDMADDLKGAFHLRKHNRQNRKNIVEAMYKIFTKPQSQDIAMGDEFLHKEARDKRREFISAERAFLFAEVLARPMTGFKLLATHLYNNQLYKNLLARLSVPNQIALNTITEASIKTNSDPEIAGDENAVFIRQALQELEVPEMLELIMNTIDINSLIGVINSNGLVRETAPLRSAMIDSLTSKVNIPLVSAVLVANDEKPSARVVEKLVQDFVRIIPPLSLKDAATGGLALPDRMMKDEKAYAEAASAAGWNSMRVFMSAMKSGKISPEESEKIFAQIEGNWHKRAAWKAGIPLPVQLMKLLETRMNYSVTAMNFIYTEFDNLVEKNFADNITQQAKSVDDLRKSEGSVIKALNKRGAEHSTLDPLLKLERERIVRLTHAINLFGSQLLDHGETHLTNIATTSVSDIGEQTKHWYVKINALRNIASTIIIKRRDTHQGTDEMRILTDFVKMVDSKISASLKDKMTSVIPVLQAVTTN